MEDLAAATPILIPYDGSRPAGAALPAASWLAADDATALLLQVVPEPEPIRNVVGETIVERADVARLARQAAETALATAAEQLRGQTPRCRIEPIVMVGDPAEAIVATARDRDVSLIVLSAYGGGASPARPVFGSVAERVARTASVPVLIVQPGDEGPAPVQRLVVPLDGSTWAERQPPVARAIARRRDLPVHLLNVVDAAERLVPPLGGDVDRLRFDEFVAGCHAAAAQSLESHGARCLQDGVMATWDVANGPAAATILDALADGDLIILSSHGQHGSQRWRLGSVAEKLIQYGRAHVLLLPAPPDIVAAAEAGAKVPAADEDQA